MSQYCFFIAASWGDAAVPKHFKALAQRLVERGHRVVYLPHGQQVSIDVGNFHVRSFPSPRPISLRDFIFLHKLVREYQPDCMIANFGAVNVMTIVGWLNRVPCRVNWYHSFSKAFEIEDDAPHLIRKFLMLRKKLVYSFSTDIAAVSDATRRELVSTYGIDTAKTHIVYNALSDPLELLSISGTATPQGAMTCVGGLFPWKGQDILIRATRNVVSSFPHTRVEFIGSGPKLGSYSQLIIDSGLEQYCFLVGKLSHLQVLEKVRQSYIAIVPSREDSFPYVVLEAMAVGTPIIASRVGGIPEAVRDGIDGFLIPPNDPEALAQKIKILYSNQALREQMGQNARQRFLDLFELTKNIEQQVKWFEDLVHQRRL